MRKSKLFWPSIKVAVFLISLIPFMMLLLDTIRDQLGPNPIQALHYSLGDWALRFLCMTLAITPIRKITGCNWLSRFRRMLGLYAFFYALMHFLVYVVLDLSLSMAAFIDEVPKSPYILVGLFTFLILLILAVTSTKNMQKRLGKSWVKLHRLVYVAAIAAIVHFLWLVKSDYSEPLIYLLIMTILLGYRVLLFIKNRKSYS